jgi:DNA helicase IV
MAARQVKPLPEISSASRHGGGAGGDAFAAAMRTEQEFVTRAYARLDAEREQAATALRAGPGQGGGSVLQAHVEREVGATEAARRLARLTAVERALVFGRIDHRVDPADELGEPGRPGKPGEDRASGETFYIGRIGLRDEDREPLLIDWRAPAARPFYTATPGSPGTLARRRHIHTRERTVIGLDDEVFDLDGLDPSARGDVVGEAALLATLRRGRTGRMTDVVATIQEEQDQVIRSGLHGVLVVQGGPGTGKTVAALHRAAYLLYTHRDVLERRGVLIVGPNATFLRYIEQVLPGLGETDVALLTVGELYPGVRATAPEPPAVAVLKGDLRMADLVEAAVRDKQRVPGGDLEIAADEMTLRVPHRVCLDARDRARRVRAPHNVQRRLYVHDLLEALARDRADQYDRLADEPLEEIMASGQVPDWLRELMDEAEDSPLLDETDLKLSKEALWADPAVRSAIDELWPELTPQSLLSGLFADPEALGRVGARAGLSSAERRLLHRAPGSPWTVPDVPLLDEAAEWLGQDDTPERIRRRREEAERADEELYAREVIQSTGVAELIMMDGRPMIDAATIAGLNRAGDPAPTTAERAASDRQWAYGHVIVDEAQELSEMAWRTVMRRVPTRSLTVVGDIAQTGSPAGARSWGRMLDRYVPGRWREQRLLINYRTPAAIMKVAADVLAAVAPDQTPPEPVRDDGPPPAAIRIPPGELEGRLPLLVAAELGRVGGDSGEGRLAVISSCARHAAVCTALPDAPAGATPEALDSRVVVLTAEEAKGLEFDSVIVVDPAGIVGESPRGGQDLYVAITRPTRRLTVVHDNDLPPTLAGLSPSG